MSLQCQPKWHRCIFAHLIVNANLSLIPIASWKVVSSLCMIGPTKLCIYANCPLVILKYSTNFAPSNISSCTRLWYSPCSVLRWNISWTHRRPLLGKMLFFFLFFFIVHRKRIRRAHIRHNLIQATHCYVNTYHNGYTIHVLPNFLYIHIYIHTYIHTLMYRHLHVSTYTYTHIYIFKPEVFFFLANENIVHKTRMQKIWFTFGLVIYIFYHIF